MTTTHPAPDVYGRDLALIDEIAKVTKRTVDDVRAECTEFGFFILADWADRPGIAQDEARALVTGDARTSREHDAAWAAHLADCAAWTSNREAAVRAAYKDAGGDRGHGPDADSRARDAATATGRAYEHSTPVPLWQGEESGNAVRQYSERPLGLLKRAAARVKAGAR